MKNEIISILCGPLIELNINKEKDGKINYKEYGFDNDGIELEIINGKLCCDGVDMPLPFENSIIKKVERRQRKFDNNNVIIFNENESIWSCTLLNIIDHGWMYDSHKLYIPIDDSFQKWQVLSDYRINYSIASRDKCAILTDLGLLIYDKKKNEIVRVTNEKNISAMTWCDNRLIYTEGGSIKSYDEDDFIHLGYTNDNESFVWIKAFPQNNLFATLIDSSLSILRIFNMREKSKRDGKGNNVKERKLLFFDHLVDINLNILSSNMSNEFKSLEIMADNNTLDVFIHWADMITFLPVIEIGNVSSREKTVTLQAQTLSNNIRQLVKFADSWIVFITNDNMITAINDKTHWQSELDIISHLILNDNLITISSQFHDNSYSFRFSSSRPLAIYFLNWYLKQGLKDAFIYELERNNSIKELLLEHILIDYDNLELITLDWITDHRVLNRVLARICRTGELKHCIKVFKIFKSVDLLVDNLLDEMELESASYLVPFIIEDYPILLEKLVKILVENERFDTILQIHKYSIKILQSVIPILSDSSIDSPSLFSFPHSTHIDASLKECYIQLIRDNNLIKAHRLWIHFNDILKSISSLPFPPPSPIVNLTAIYVNLDIPMPFPKDSISLPDGFIKWMEEELKWSKVSCLWKMIIEKDPKSVIVNWKPEKLKEMVSELEKHSCLGPIKDLIYNHLKEMERGTVNV